MSGNAEQEAAALMMRGFAAQHGLTEEMETIISELKEVQARAVAKLGDSNGMGAFVCAYTVLGAELSK